MVIVKAAFLSAIAAFAFVSSAHADPKYCANGTGVAQVTQQPRVAADDIKKRCSAGDTIIIPQSSSGLIAMVCDFAKSITVARSDVICVIGQIRDIR